MNQAHASKFAPHQSGDSMGTIARRAPEPGTAAQALKQRFRVAIAGIKAATGQTSGDLADALGIPHKAFDHAMSMDPARHISLSRVQDAERMLQSIKATATDAEIIQAVRDLISAEARFAAIKQNLLEAAA